MDIHLFKPGNKMSLVKASQELTELIKELEEQATNKNIQTKKLEPPLCYYKELSNWEYPITSSMCYSCDGNNKSCNFYVQNTK